MMKEHSYSVLFGSRGPNGRTCEGWREFDHIIGKFLTEQRIPGASVAISQNGNILYEQGYGIAGASRRVQPESIFRIASISKPITAAIVLKLCEKHKVPLDTKIFCKNGILKKYRTRDKRMKNITIKHLLQHSAGWDRDKVGDAVFVRPQCVVKEHPDSQAYNSALLSYALRRKLQFSPGTWHSYSNLGYLVLGEVIEAVSGQPFHQVMTSYLQQLDIHNISLGKRPRAQWESKEVEYFNNREPQVGDSIYPHEGLVLPQYGGMAMESSGSYGGLISDTLSLLRFAHCMEEAVRKKNLVTEDKVDDHCNAFYACLDHDGGNDTKNPKEVDSSTSDASSPGQLKESRSDSENCRITENYDFTATTGSSTNKDFVSFVHGSEDTSVCNSNISDETEQRHTSLTSSSLFSIQTGNLKKGNSCTSKHCVQPSHYTAVHGKCTPSLICTEAGCDHWKRKSGTEDLLRNDDSCSGSSCCRQPDKSSGCVTLEDKSTSSPTDTVTVRKDENLHNQEALSSHLTTCTKPLWEKRKLKSLLSAEQVKKTLARPYYENGRDWYGLGWDVQDEGQSWGHTGGMEGTCGTLQYHKSGLTWAFLLNSWAVDSDLNGVIKCALCSVPNLNMYNHEVLSWEGECGIRITTLDKSQFTLLGVTQSSVRKVVKDVKFQGYFVTWITNMKQDLACIVQELLKNKESDNEFEPNLAKQANQCSNNALIPKEFEEKYIVVFQKSKVKDYVVVFNKTAKKLQAVCAKYEKKNFHIDFVDSFCSSQNKLKFNAVFKQDNAVSGSNITLHLAMKATEYVKKARQFVKSYHILVQSVTEVKDELYVSFILSAKSPVLKNSKLCSTPTIETNVKCQDDDDEHLLSDDTYLNVQDDELKQYVDKSTSTSDMNSEKISKSSSTRKTKAPQTKKGRKRKMSMTASNSDTIYWVQITPESFLTELNRQVSRRNGLVYAKFYTAENKPFVSGCWLPEKGGNCYQRTALSKYGLVPELVEAATNNVRLQCLSEYKEEDGSVYYAAIWYAS